MSLEFEVVKISIQPKNLREMRAKSGMTLKEVSKRTGLSTGFINDLEFKRRTCSKENFDKLQKALR